MQYQEQEQVLQQLTLPMILSRDDLCLQEIFSLKDIQSKIKRQMKIFIEYCRGNEGFTDRLISLGLKCPMHQSNNLQMKNVAYIAADILTSDHEAVADLLIHGRNNQQKDSEDEDLIVEEIQGETETQESKTTGQAVQQVDKYKYLSKIVEYLQGETLQENCLNYITKCLMILVRKKLNAFLQYFQANPQTLERLGQLAHFPSVARLLGKLITDDEDNMSESAMEVRRRILPMLLRKIRAEVDMAGTLEVFQSIEDILQSSRYGDVDFGIRSELQCLTDAAVSEEEISFHLENLLVSLQSINAESLSSVFNSSTFLSLVVTRMNMDEQHDYSDQPQPFKPTLKYQVDKLFNSFCRLVQAVGQIELFREINPGVFKLVIVKQFQLLALMAKHSRFGGFYAVVSKEERLNAIKFLISGIARRRFSGILLQLASSLVEKIVLEEEKIAESHPESGNKVSPSQMFQIISDHQLHLSETVHELAHQGMRQRNRNQQGIYLRKLLVLFDNFFKNTEIHKHFPEIQTITKLFPAFSPDKCKKYADITAISNHPGGARAKTPEEFKFMQRNKDFMKNLIVDELGPNPAEPVVESPSKQREVNILFKLQGRIQTLKDKVKDKQVVKEEVVAEKNVESPSEREKKEVQVDSPSRHNSPQPCLLFFIRHLTIY